MNLAELHENEKAIITKVKGRGTFRKRIMEMGFVKGKEIKVIKSAPLRDPIEFEVMDYQVSLRRSEARFIEVLSENEKIVSENGEYQDLKQEGDFLKNKARIKGKTISVALVGNPNSGKTTLFNNASGSHEHVGNYSGVTIESKKAKFRLDGYTFEIIDLPGTYSLSAYSPEELYVRKYITENLPDIVVNVVDASNLERNLYLTTQLIDMDIRVVVALNMFDELKEKDADFNYDLFGEMTGIPFVPTIGSKGKGIADLFRKVISVYEDRESKFRHIHINYGITLEESIKKIQSKIKLNLELTDFISSRFLAIKLIEKDKEIENELKSCFNFNEIIEVTSKEISKIETLMQDDTESLVTDARYGFVAGAIRETYIEALVERRKKTDEIDTLITHKVFGIPVFIFFMWIMFQATFVLGAYPKKWIENLVALIANYSDSVIPAGSLKDLIVEGVIGGVGGVIVFLPNILILFFFISLMEDTGYMARAAFIMDRIMHKIGLHGKSFIPLIMGFGCNVPAIMATRTLENRNDRLLTMLINPFMSCSARLPVYLLIIGAFFPNNQGTILFLIYLIGILFAVTISIIFKKTIFKHNESPFVMELPPYRIPTSRTIVKHMWNRTAQYLRKMGGVILVASIIIWALSYYPKSDLKIKSYESKIDSLSLMTFTKDSLLIKSEIEKLTLEKNSYQKSNSYIGKLGKFIEPAIRPLGFDWRIGVSLLIGIAGKEIVISTLGVLYQVDIHTKGNSVSLTEKLKNATFDSGKYVGKKVITSVSAFSIMIFVLIYFPCIAVIATIRKESGKAFWAIFTILFTTSLAWISSFLVFQLGSLLL